MSRYALTFLILLSALVASGIGETQARQACAGPYRVLTSDNRCVWTCAAGTRPDRASNTCTCQTGLSPNGRDRFGRLTCARPQASSDLPPLQIKPVLPLVVPQLRAPQPPREQATNHAADNPFNTRPVNLCNIFYRQNSSHQFAYRCSIAHQHPIQLELTQRMVITVRKDRPLQADVTRAGRYDVMFRRPAQPPRNRDCNEQAIGVPGACEPQCARLEYLTFFDDGSLRGLLRANPGSRAVCDRDFSGEYTIETPGKALAYDACSRKAVERNLERWNHQTLIRLPKRVAAAFGFEDNHTSGGGRNWQFHQQVQHRMIYEDLSLPVVVNCR